MYPLFFLLYFVLFIVLISVNLLLFVSSTFRIYTLWSTGILKPQLISLFISLLLRLFRPYKPWPHQTRRLVHVALYKTSIATDLLKLIRESGDDVEAKKSANKC